MKKLPTVLLGFLSVLVLLFLVSTASTAMLLKLSPAADLGEGVVLHSQTTQQNDLTIVDETLCYPDSATADTCTADRVKTLYHGDTLIGQIVFRVTFTYDGTQVSVKEKALLQADTFSGWRIRQTELTADGGSVTLTGRLSKWLVMNVGFSMGLTCDATGTISCS